MLLEFDIEALMEKLILIEKVEKGLEQFDSGNAITHEQLKQKVKQWPK